MDSVQQVDNTQDLLKERGGKYGPYHKIALFTQVAEDTLFALDTKEYDDELLAVARESAHMIIQKLARAFNGDLKYQDNWDDIAGYAKLVSEYLNK